MSEWQAYHQLEPLPDPYLIAALQCQVMTNLWSKRHHTLADFYLPKLLEAGADPEETAEESFQKFFRLATAHNARNQGNGSTSK